MIMKVFLLLTKLFTVLGCNRNETYTRQIHSFLLWDYKVTELPVKW